MLLQLFVEEFEGNIDDEVSRATGELQQEDIPKRHAIPQHELLATPLEKIVDTVQVFVKENVRMEVIQTHSQMPNKTLIGREEEKTLEIFDTIIKNQPLMSQHNEEMEQ